MDNSNRSGMGHPVLAARDNALNVAVDLWRALNDDSIGEREQVGVIEEFDVAVAAYLYAVCDQALHS